MNDAHPTQPPPAPTRERFEVAFGGRAAEYFRIWIVNIALTLLTLGIYSAWATVRNKQYFYANTRLAESSFEYTAHPLTILKGRLLVLGVLLAYQLAAMFLPGAALALTVLIVPLVPWVVVKAVGFNLRYSSYRGLRFGFDGRYGEALRVYLLWPLAGILTLGLAYPYAVWRRKQFLVTRARFGGCGFDFNGEAGFFYLVYLVGGIVFAGVLVLATVVITAAIALLGIGSGLEGIELGTLGRAVALGAMASMYLLILLSFLVFTTAVQALLANYIWQHTSIGEVNFDLRLNVWRVSWIQASNLLAIIASLGLLIPWARVRMARYRLSCFAMLATSAALESFVAAERERIGATGAEAGQVLDLDLGL